MDYALAFGPIENLKDSTKDLALELWDQIKDAFVILAQNLQEGANIFLKEMIDFVLYTPDIAGDPIIIKLWTIIRTISFALVGVMFVWEGFKKGVSMDLIRTVEFKQMFTRMIYGIILSVFSLDLIDIIIHFNDALIQTMKDNFPILIETTLNTTGVFSTIMVIVLLVVQVVIGIKLILQYWMRMAEIWLMAVLGPLMYTLWINPNWSGYLSQWFRRLTTTIFTTFVWSVIIALYSAMVSLVATTGMLVGFPTLGPIAAMCLSISLLLVMVETPSFLAGFMDSHQNALKLAKNNITSIVRTVKNPVGKAAGWLKPRSS
ncbi:hypothetical protein D3C81_753420 [compost metagenome]